MSDSVHTFPHLSVILAFVCQIQLIALSFSHTNTNTHTRVCTHRHTCTDAYMHTHTEFMFTICVSCQNIANFDKAVRGQRVKGLQIVLIFLFELWVGNKRPIKLSFSSLMFSFHIKCLFCDKKK